MPLNILIEGDVVVLSNFSRLMNDPRVCRRRPGNSRPTRTRTSEICPGPGRSQRNRLELSGPADDHHTKDSKAWW